MFNNEKKLLFSNNFSLEINKKPLNPCVWSVALYGSETQTQGKNAERVIHAFKTRCWRRTIEIN
jgi:hypothetical protein